MTKSPPRFVDLADFDEDFRIDAIVHQVRDHKKTVGFIVEDEAGKADRYIKKLRAKLPGITVHGPVKGPVAGTVTVKVGPPTDA